MPFEQTSERRLEELEVMGRKLFKDDVEKGVVDEQMVLLRKTFTDIVDEVMDEKITTMNSEAMKQIIKERMPMMDERFSKVTSKILKGSTLTLRL